MSLLSTLGGGRPGSPSPGGLGLPKAPPFLPSIPSAAVPGGQSIDVAHGLYNQAPPQMGYNIDVAHGAQYGPTGSFQTPPAPAAVPQTPKQAVPSIWDKQHRSDTLLGISAALLGTRNLGDGLAGVANSLLQSRQGLKAGLVKDEQIGGPDNAFRIITDPTTGHKTYEAIPEAQAWIMQKHLAPTDPHGAAASIFGTINRLPADQQQAALDTARAHAGILGTDASLLPATYDKTYGALAEGTGISPENLAKNELAATKAAEAARQNAIKNAQRDRALGQGDARVGLAREAGNRAAHKAAAGADTSKYEYRTDPATGRVQRRLKR